MATQFSNNDNKPWKAAYFAMLGWARRQWGIARRFHYSLLAPSALSLL